MDKDNPQINCPIFQKQEPIIKEITNKINQAREVQEKARNSLELEKEINVLLNCSDYDEKRLDCGCCHFVADLGKRTTNLIIKAKKLA